MLKSQETIAHLEEELRQKTEELNEITVCILSLIAVSFWLDQWIIMYPMK